MRLVDKPHTRPMHCAALPFMGQTSRCRWVDTGAELPGFDNHVYLSEPAVLEAGRCFGFPTPAEYTDLQADLAAERVRVADLEAERDRLRAQVEAVHVLKQGGFGASRKPGRPPKEKSEKVVTSG